MDRREFAKRLGAGVVGIYVLGSLGPRFSEHRNLPHHYSYDGEDIWVDLPSKMGEEVVTVKTFSYDRTRAISGVRVWDKRTGRLVEEKRFSAVNVVQGDSICYTATYYGSFA